MPCSNEVVPVKTLDNGLIFHVENGKGLLRSKYGSLGDRGLFSLVFNDVPLIKFHGDYYSCFCPTCEKLISAGYGLNMCGNSELKELGEVFNATFVSIEKSFDDLKPLFGLLSTGYYMLSDEELFPTDGQGNFFWNIPCAPVKNRATCAIHDSESFDWSDPVPKYILPTQPPTLFNRKRAEYYRAKDDTRAIAYHMDGYLCALLDGHHKATAAALDGKPIKTLVIGGACGFSVPTSSTGMKAFIYFHSTKLNEEEMLESLDEVQKTWSAVTTGNKMSEDETARYLSMKNDDFEYEWPEEILKTADNYFDVTTLARLEWAGDLSDSRLDAILSGKAPQDESEIRNVALALCVTNNPRFVNFAIHFCKDERYVHIWHELFKLLAKTKTRQVEDFFIDFIVNDEKTRPYITKIVDRYFIEA